MKTIIPALFLSLGSLSAFAQPINLQPGSSIAINGDLVTCVGTAPENLAPLCSIRKEGLFYRLYADNSVAESFNSFDDAVAGAKQMKEAGLCR